MERGRGKGVHLGLLEMFFHCGEAKEGFIGGNFFDKFIMGRGKGCTEGFGCRLIFFLFF